MCKEDMWICGQRSGHPEAPDDLVFSQVIGWKDSSEETSSEWRKLKSVVL